MWVGVPVTETLNKAHLGESAPKSHVFASSGPRLETRKIEKAKTKLDRLVPTSLDARRRKGKNGNLLILLTQFGFGRATYTEIHLISRLASKAEMAETTISHKADNKHELERLRNSIFVHGLRGVVIIKKEKGGYRGSNKSTASCTKVSLLRLDDQILRWLNSLSPFRPTTIINPSGVGVPCCFQSSIDGTGSNASSTG